MIILHAGTLSGRFLLWGEQSPEELREMKKRRGRKPKIVSPQTFPYAAEKEALLSTLLKTHQRFDEETFHATTIFVWLPSGEGQPLVSSPLIAERTVTAAKKIFSAWSIPALDMPFFHAVDFLCHCSGKEILDTGVVIGKDIKYWVMAMKFAGALIARGQFLPGIVQESGNYYARWQPIFDGESTARLAQMANAMPHVCRALTDTSEAVPTKASLAVLSDFIVQMLDCLVRMELSGGVKGRKKEKKTSDGNLHEIWLRALNSLDSKIKAPQAELAQFIVQLKEWQRPVAVTAKTPFRLCLRLEEPPDGAEEKLQNEQWVIRFLLQATDDPSLLIEVKDAWAAKGRKASLLKRYGFNAREYLLSSLGQAISVCPFIEKSLKTASPSECAINTKEAYEFLTETAWLLEQFGFKIIFPGWWTRKGTTATLGVRAKVRTPAMQAGGFFSLDQIVLFDWELALGDKTITLDELKMLARLKMPLVKMRKQWVQLDVAQIGAVLKFWEKRAQHEGTVRDVLQMSLGSVKEIRGVQVLGVETSGWIADLLKKLDESASIEPVPSPEGFQGTLRPYQTRGYAWLNFLRQWGLGACLADDMGLGKTIQALALLQRNWETGERRPTLLICPTSVIGNWLKETRRFTPDLPVMVHHGLEREKGKTFQKQAEGQAFVISSYSLLHRDLSTLELVPWAGVILDEAQNIKNPETKQAKVARALKCDYRLALTGTPVENNVGDLWSIMEFLNPGLLGSRAEFKRNFFIPIQADRDAEAMARLKKISGPFILRRLKSDKTIIADLPEKMEIKVFCTLTKEQASLYQAVTEEVTEKLNSAEGIERKGVILAALSKLKQVCNHPAQFLGDNSAIPHRSGKLERLREMIEEILEGNENLLIFSQFTEMGAIIRRYLQESLGAEVLFLHGGTPKKQRDEMVERFQSEKHGPRIFLLSLKAGGTGLNLTRANHVFHFDRWWNPAVENQATDRVFRIGQTKNVQVYKFLCLGTLEEKIDEMIENKKGIAAEVISSGEQWLTELSTKELKNLFALRQEAVAE